MGDGKMKVTDKRMFTPDGELREEYRDLLERPSSGREEVSPAGEEGTPAGSPPPAREPGTETREGAGAKGRVEVPGTPGPFGTPGFLDLVHVLAQPVLIYLGEARGPGGESMEDLEMARLHIDLLDVLRRKTVGNLSAQESQALEDLIYQLRMRYVEKRG